jgi:hypothetical protein
VQAIPLYRKLNQAVPNNPGVPLNLGMAVHMAGKNVGPFRSWGQQLNVIAA